MPFKNARVLWLGAVRCCLGTELAAAAEPAFAVHCIRKDPSWVTSVHQVILADIDKDGDLDWTVGNVHKNPNLFWFENVDGKALQWRKHADTLIGLEGPWGAAVKTVYRDMDFDGDRDVVQSECDHRGAVGVAWLENTDGKGTFALRWIKPRTAEDFHTLAVIDYDNEGDWDVLSAVGPLSKLPPRVYLFENTSGKGKSPAAWKEHVILADHPCHPSD